VGLKAINLLLEPPFNGVKILILGKFLAPRFLIPCFGTMVSDLPVCSLATSKAFHLSFLHTSTGMAEFLPRSSTVEYFICMIFYFVAIYQRILSLSRDPAIGLTGIGRFHSKLREHGIAITRKALTSLLQTQPEHELFRRAPESLGNSIAETGVCTGMQADLADTSLISRRNQGFHWILTVVDVYSACLGCS
jgi:hypothetical protein